MVWWRATVLMLNIFGYVAGFVCDLCSFMHILAVFSNSAHIHPVLSVRNVYQFFAFIQRPFRPALVLLYTPDGAHSFSRPSTSYETALTDN